MFFDPDFSLYKSSCDIDYARFLIDKSSPPPDFLSHAKVTPLRAGGADGMFLTIHDPKPQDFVLVEKAYPTAQFNEVEVFFDLTPKRPATSTVRETMLHEIQQWLISHLYPWRGVGLQVATRVSEGRRHSEPVFNDTVERRPTPKESMYFGHSSPIYADPTLPNFAYLRLYIKKTDNKSSLLPEKWRTRVEVNLNSGGCKHYGLTTPTSIYSFNFRPLGKYLNFFKPETKTPVYRKMRRWNSKMALLLEKTRARLATETLRDVGVHSGSREKLIILDRHHRHAAANRMVRNRLDDLTDKYEKFGPVSIYGSEWGSW